MAHLVRVPDDQRISLDTIQLPPNQPLKVGVWGMTGDLKLVATRDSDWDKKVLETTKDLRLVGQGQIIGSPVCRTAPLPIPPGKKDYAASQFTFTSEGSYRIELRSGIDVWDWLRVACSTKPPVAMGENTAKGSGSLNVHIVWATAGAPHPDPLPHYLVVAKLLFAKHGFELSVTPTTPTYTEPRIKGFEKGVVCDKNFGNVQGLAAEVAKLPEYSEGKRVVVVMANARQTIEDYKDDGTLAGQTVTAKEYAISGKPFVILNAGCRSLDGATLAHQIGHAAGFCDHSTVGSHVMSYGPRRNEIPAGRIQDLEKAFFRSA
jgi:hypothetical protein